MKALISARNYGIQVGRNEVYWSVCELARNRLSIDRNIGWVMSVGCRQLYILLKEIKKERGYDYKTKGRKF